MKKTIDPGKGYCLLNDGEIIQIGDEYHVHGRWYETSDFGKINTPSRNGFYYRRKIKTSDLDPIDDPGDELARLRDDLARARYEIHSLRMSMQDCGVTPPLPMPQDYPIDKIPEEFK